MINHISNTHIFLFLLIILLSATLSGLSSQDTGGNPDVSQAAAADTIPRSFTDIVLGSSIEEVKRQLENNRQFDYRGDPDVSFNPSGEQAIIQTGGRGFMESAVFQFHEAALFSITLIIDADQIDYFTMYRDLQSKYGDPDYLDPRSASWENDDVRMVLEKPLSVKYLDMQAFNAIREAGAAEESMGELSREMFLDNF